MATRKPVSQLSPAFRHRLEAYIADHPGADIDDPAVRKAARGHGSTPEHGSILHVQALSDRTIITTASGQEARRLVAGAARNGLRVGFAVEQKGAPGQWRHFGGHSGASAEWLLRDKRNPDRIDGEQNLKKWLQQQEFRGENAEGHAFDSASAPGGRVKNITRVQVTLYKKAA